MPLTRKFADTVAERALHDPMFKIALFEESLQAFFDGDIEGSKELLRDCINASVGFQTVSERSGIPIKSLMRMVGPKGNPRLENFTILVRAVQDEICSQTVVSVSLQDEVEFSSVQSSSSLGEVGFGESQMAEAD